MAAYNSFLDHIVAETVWPIHKRPAPMRLIGQPLNVFEVAEPNFMTTQTKYQLRLNWSVDLWCEKFSDALEIRMKALEELKHLIYGDILCACNNLVILAEHGSPHEIKEAAEYLKRIIDEKTPPKD